jgi:hypothetical protein
LFGRVQIALFEIDCCCCLAQGPGQWPTFCETAEGRKEAEKKKGGGMMKAGREHKSSTTTRAKDMMRDGVGAKDRSDGG